MFYAFSGCNFTVQNQVKKIKLVIFANNGKIKNLEEQKDEKY